MNSSPADNARADILARAAAELWMLGRLDLAEPVARLAVEADPALGGAHGTLAGALETTGRFDEALPHWREAARVQPQAVWPRLNLALALLRRDAWEEGLGLYEARIDLPGWTPMAVRNSVAANRNRMLRGGEDVAGRRILVFTEQGLGDGIMFARLLPLLAARGARLTVVCDAALRPLLARLGGIERLLSPPADRPAARVNLAALEFDRFAPLMSLPRLLGLTPETIPASPYLRADPACVAGWRTRYEAAGRPGALKLGVVFQANPDSRSAAVRSLGLASLAPLLALDRIDIVNLQAGPSGRALAAQPGVIDALAEPLSLDAFAAAVAATDLLFSADTMAVHCAGAQGHPVWLAVPRVPHWFWGLGRDTCPWYASARLFRQASAEDWGAVIARVVSALRQWAGLSTRELWG